MKVALVHDYLNEFGGAERVLAALTELYPKAPIYTIYTKKNSPAGKFFQNKTIKQSWFSYLPFASKLISPLRFLIPAIWPQFNFKDYDLVITSANWAITKGMRNAKKEICYLHSPPRYLYGYDTSFNWQGKWYGPLIDLYALVVNHFMRIYDFHQAQKVDHFIVNSRNVGERVKKFYRRSDYTIVHPPIDTSKFKATSKKQNYFLTGGRMAAAKNFDLIIRSCQKAGVILKIFGTGRQENQLRNLATSNTEFLGRVSDSELAELYASARAFIVAQADEDFGITPIEANAAGTPVIAFKGGGYLETVIDGKTGLFFNKLSVSSLVEALEKFEKLNFNQKALLTHAKRFDQATFKSQFQKAIK